MTEEKKNLIEVEGVEANDALGILDRTLGRQRRADDTPFILVSDAIVVLIDAYDVTQEQIAKYYRRTQPTVSNYYSLRNLIEELKGAALSGQLKTFRAALWLSKMPEEAQRAFYEAVGEGEIITQKSVMVLKKTLKGDTISLAGKIDIPDSKPDVLPAIKIKLPPGGLQVLGDTGKYSLDKGGRTYIIVAELE